MSEPRSSLYRLANGAVKGQLPRLIADLRAEGLPWVEVAIRLRMEHDVRVSTETLRTWAIELGIEAPVAS